MMFILPAIPSFSSGGVAAGSPVIAFCVLEAVTVGPGSKPPPPPLPFTIRCTPTSRVYFNAEREGGVSALAQALPQLKRTRINSGLKCFKCINQKTRDVLADPTVRRFLTISSPQPHSQTEMVPCRRNAAPPPPNHRRLKKERPNGRLMLPGTRTWGRVLVAQVETQVLHSCQERAGAQRYAWRGGGGRGKVFICLIFYCRAVNSSKKRTIMS
jgi:hypothetical protein